MSCKTVAVPLSSVLLLLLLLLVGCTSSPSVAPLLRLSQGAVTAEAARLRADVELDARSIDATRAALADAFEADLRQRGSLDSAWVLEATDVYLAAREALLADELARRHARQRRAENLEAAAEATARALDLIEQRDRLFADTTLARLWRLLGDDPTGDQP